MIKWASAPPQRWDEHEISHDATIPNDSIDAHLRATFSDGQNVQQDVEQLLPIPIIGVDISDGTETYVCESEPAQFSYGQTRAYWVHQAFEIFYCAFTVSPPASLQLTALLTILIFQGQDHWEEGYWPLSGTFCFNTPK